MKKLLMLGLLALAVLSTGARAEESAKAGAKTGTTKAGKPYFEATEKATATATVVKIEKSSRHVSFRSEAGDTLRVKAGAEVKNFAQLAVGDVVEVTYTEKLTITVEPAGAAELTSETMTAANKLGEKPGAGVTERTQYKATIESIDTAGGTATLKGYDGEQFVVTPIHRENLGKVKVGELVVFTHTQAVAATVKKVTAK